MKKEVIFTGKNTEVIKILETQLIRLIPISRIKELNLTTRTVYLHFDDTKESQNLNETEANQLAWAKNKGIPTICISLNLNTKKSRNFYEAGFQLVFKADSKMDALLNYLKGQPEHEPEVFYTKSKIYNKAMKGIFSSLVSSRAPLLIYGQTGVGKTHTLKAMVKHLFPNKVFINKNLSELSPHLIESELFGHKKGSFTGAANDRKGLFEQANGGFLFLDEIATVPLKTQQKILKVIEEKVVTPVGSHDSIKLDFQLITATCDNLKDLILNNMFREDLYYRLAVTSFEIPSISQRREELEEILFDIQKNSDLQISFSDEAIQILKENEWKGNYRELQSLLHELRVERVHYVKPENLPKRYINTDELNETSLLTGLQEEIIHSMGLPELIKRLEIESFKKTFKALGGRTNKICDDLKISKSVYYRISQAI